MHDVIVVGGSVAGAATSIYLARLGMSVHLIDQRGFPRTKACGEGIFPPGVRVLEDLGVFDELLPKGRALRSLSFEIDGDVATASLGAGEASAFGIRREDLDAALLQQAERAGVQVSLGVKALGLLCDEADRFGGVMTDCGEMKARAVIAADGLGSRLRRSAGLDVPTKTHRYGLSAHYRLQSASDPTIRVLFRRDHEIYMTPVGSGLVNVALLLNHRRIRALSGRLVEGFRELAENDNPVLFEATLVDGPRASGPFPAAARRAWRRNLVLAGDAAGFYDGITGEGISLALVSARGCAEAVSAYLGDGRTEHFNSYEKARRELVRPSTVLARICLAFASRPWLGKRAVRRLARKPELFGRLLAINQGESPLSSLRLRDVFALLLGV